MQAEMDVHAAAGAVGHRHGREADAVTEAKGCGARELAGDHRLVCRLQRWLRGDGQLVLARAIFRQEGVSLSPAARSAATTLSPNSPCGRQAPRL